MASSYGGLDLVIWARGGGSGLSSLAHGGVDPAIFVSRDLAL